MPFITANSVVQDMLPHSAVSHLGKQPSNVYRPMLYINGAYESAHKMLILIAYAQKPHFKAHADVYMELEVIILVWIFLYFHMRGLVRAVAARQCDKYQNLMCWHYHYKKIFIWMICSTDL